MGSLYKRGNTWWLKYYAHGGAVRESARTANEREARTLLALREGAVARGEPVRPTARRLTVNDLLADLLTEYRTNGRHSIRTLVLRITRHLLPAFGRHRAIELTTADCRQYVSQRQAEGAANATINRELAALRRAYRLAVQDGRLVLAPHIPTLQEDNVRTGFFEPDQFAAVLRHLPTDLQLLARVAYVTGWRVRSELLPLQWRQVDFVAGELCLDPGTTKNRDGRVFPFTSELRACLEAQRATTDTVQQTKGIICPWVFHRTGDRIWDFRRAWRRAVTAAGVPGRIPHDFRRTACRNLIRAGVPERVAMALVGWRSRALLDRYNIVSRGDLQQAAALLTTAAALPVVGSVRPRCAPSSSSSTWIMGPTRPLSYQRG